jgi:hypothetical protein
MHARPRTLARTRRRARTHACTHAHAHTHARAHTRMHSRTRTHTHTHTHTHTDARARARTHACTHTRAGARKSPHMNSTMSTQVFTTHRQMQAGANLRGLARAQKPDQTADAENSAKEIEENHPNMHLLQLVLPHSSELQPIHTGIPASIVSVVGDCHESKALIAAAILATPQTETLFFM